MRSSGASYRLPVGLRSLASAEVAEGPGCVPQHAQLAAVTQKGKQGAESTGLENKVAACGAVTGDVAKRPHGLLPDVRLVAAEQFDEDGDGTGLDDDLCLLCGAGGNVGEGPGGLELHQRVGGAQELDEAADHASLDNALDGGVALLGQQLAELCRRLDLLVDLFGEDALDHLGELFAELALDVSRPEQRQARRGMRTCPSMLPPSSSLSGAAPSAAPGRSAPPPMPRRFARFSSRFARRISTCCSSRRRRSSSGLKALLALNVVRRCSGMYLSAMSAATLCVGGAVVVSLLGSGGGQQCLFAGD